MKRVQILALRKGEDRWRFVAYGAPYALGGEAEQMRDTLVEHGHKVKFLPVPKAPRK